MPVRRGAGVSGEEAQASQDSIGFCGVPPLASGEAAVLEGTLHLDAVVMRMRLEQRRLQTGGESRLEDPVSPITGGKR
ncbi:MAG: hypothetical protein M1296_00670 [Chloroflexi bacterium]|nr:hypothetical protein [Chloroflexota bacterium]